MAEVVVVSALVALAIGITGFIRRRRVPFSALDRISVSRQWLMQHQADDRS
ncbi:MAG: hypothetical protein AB7H96_25185 [Vicinamibacterales bacterium]